MNKTNFVIELKKHFSFVDENMINLIEQYKNLVQEYNQQFNLTRLDDDSLIYEQFILDSLIPYKDLNWENQQLSLIDIGTGSGIPGILLKIVFPSLKVVLLEANSKKCSFLNIVINALNLSDIEVWNMRAEELSSKMRESFDIATSRAVASLYKILEISSPFVKVGGYLVQPKGLNLESEQQIATNTINILGLEQVNLLEYKLTNHTHKVVIYQKQKVTDLDYPRSWSLISKKPL
ncbi:16S rRNA (guanine(527)-N(7))-methyltransferase RsmG [Ureaplasma diversum]|uniref:Ribosomal RNA small subunit methyltransferase G n=1 Tax=Ureaplasma diversum NCTC 246 TaxID=1188241 RepID=A0A084EX97_9BACT|nr:16S rRNA (guanine(527)-N(7))-methyltransferase RsmG [Ureaplasma diversum]KEZ22589.1 Ribosomal RNA small subunit methyltransferase G [Ureaplasma diversum NCTC 246]